MSVARESYQLRVVRESAIFSAFAVRHGLE